MMATRRIGESYAPRVDETHPTDKEKKPMRSVRAVVVVAFVLLAAACGSDSATSTTSTTAGAPIGGLSTTIPSGGGPVGGANGSVTFTITGEYQASGTFDFIPVASVFSNGGWSASFTGASGDAIIAMNSMPGSLIVSYGDSQVVIGGTEDTGCTFDFTRNDASGLAGTFSCSGLVGGNAQTGSPLSVTFSGQFDAHL